MFRDINVYVLHTSISQSRLHKYVGTYILYNPIKIQDVSKMVRKPIEVTQGVILLA